MCGIAGFVVADADLTSDVARARLTLMARMIAHRGPDDEAVWFEDGVGLAHRRLSVIDPTPHGRQPMRRGDLTVAYNGEIYNYRALRRELEAAGARFETQTDTEVLLAAFERWGERALDRLDGMFAFALWNRSARTLMLARDRAGEKPLYYAETPKGFFFASEIKAILAHPDVERRPDDEAIHHYLSLQYVPAPFSAFEGVRALPPASALTLRPGSEPALRRYWTLPHPTAAQAPKAGAGAIGEELRALLKQAVADRMVADVPVGAFLSGGVDSSAVVAFMSEAVNRPIKTYSIGFDDPAYDERSFARLVAERFGTEHVEEVVRPDAASLLPEIVWHYGQPFADPSAIPTYFVSRLARRDVTVALSGDGGDEFFMGYQRYLECARFDNARRPAAARAIAAAAAAAMPGGLSQVRPFRGLKRRLEHFGAAPATRYEASIMYYSHADKAAAYGPRFEKFLERPTTDLFTDYFDASPSMASGAAFLDIHTYLPDDILVKVDVASMAHGLETRAPFLAPAVMEWAARLPAEFKMRDGNLKSLLKSALRPVVPGAVLDRPKMGFGVPIDRWFRDSLHDFAADILLSRAARERGIMRPGHAERLLDEHRRGERHHHLRLWALLMLELWFREWIDGAVREKPRVNALA